MTVISIYATFRVRLLRFAMSLCHDEHTAFDLVQQTFLKVCEHEQTLSGYSQGRLEGWLMMTLKHAFIDQLRKTRAQSGLEAIQEMSQEADFSKGMVADLMNRLPEPIRICVQLRHFEGLNATEIGTQLNLPAATVRTRLRVGAKLLKQHYEED